MLMLMFLVLRMIMNWGKKPQRTKTGDWNNTSGQVGAECPRGGLSCHAIWSQRNHLLSGMQRALFNISRWSYGCWVIVPCLHIKHGCVLTLHRSSSLDVVGWNGMLDRVRNIHHTTAKKTRNLVHANRRNHSYIPVHKLFKGSFETVYTDTLRRRCLRRDSWDIHWCGSDEMFQHETKGRGNQWAWRKFFGSYSCILYGTDRRGKQAEMSGKWGVFCFHIFHPQPKTALWRQVGHQPVWYEFFNVPQMSRNSSLPQIVANIAD